MTLKSRVPLLLGLLTSLVLMATMATHTLARSSFAHGEDDRFEIFRGQEGAYLIIVGIQPEYPRVGMVHFSITPLVAKTLLSVDAPKISIVAVNEEGKPMVQALALPEFDPPLYYDANLSFGSPGNWQLRVSVESEAFGKELVSIPMVVGRQSVIPSGAGTIVFLIVIAIIIAGIASIWYNERRKRSMVTS